MRAGWAEEERSWLDARLASEHTKKQEALEHIGIGKALDRSARAGLRLRLFLPQRGELRRRLLPADHHQGLWRQQFPDRPALPALPFLFGAVGMVLLGLDSSDRTLKRREHVCFALLLATVGVAGAGLVSMPVLVLGLLCLGQIGVSAMPPLFWPIPSAFLTGTSAAAGIAAINSIGNLSGFFGLLRHGLPEGCDGQLHAGPAAARRLRLRRRDHRHAAPDGCAAARRPNRAGRRWRTDDAPGPCGADDARRAGRPTRGPRPPPSAASRPGR